MHVIAQEFANSMIPRSKDEELLMSIICPDINDYTLKEEIM